MGDFKNLKEDLLKDVQQLKEKAGRYKEEKNRSMGLGPLLSPDIVFVRKFRWTLRSKILLEQFVKKVVFNFASRTIEVEVMEVVCTGDDDLNVHQWLESDLSKDELVFTTYDGCGKALYQYQFNGLTLGSDQSDFDYSTSDESVRKVLLYFDDYSRTYLAKPQTAEAKPIKKCYKWTLQLEGDTVGVEYDVKTEARPQLEIEETEINFLAAKTWIPGKAHWHDLTFTFDRQHDMELLNRLIKGTEPNLYLHLYSWDKSQKFETWVLKNVKMVRLKHEEDKYTLTVRYPEVRYINNLMSEGEKNEIAGKGKDKPQLRKGECQPAS